LITSESAGGFLEAPRIETHKDRTVSIDGCGKWSIDAVRSGKLPKPTGGVDAKVASLIQAGRKATAKGDYRAAIKAFTQAIGKEPSAIKAWSGRGYAHLRAARPEQALADFQHALKTHKALMSAKTLKMVKHNIAQAEKAIAAKGATP